MEDDIFASDDSYAGVGSVGDFSGSTGDYSIPLNAPLPQPPGGSSYTINPDGSIGLSPATGTTSTNQVFAGVNSVANSIASIFQNLTGTGQPTQTYYANGQPIPAAGNNIAGVASNLTSTVASFLPLILIGAVLYFVFRAFAKHTR